MTEQLYPNVADRKRLFYWLKQISSYTAWNRILGYYQAWAAVSERITQIMEDEQTKSGKKAYFNTKELIPILKGLADCENGVQRLRKGDKQVFRFTPTGDFSLSRNISNYWGEAINRAQQGELELNQDKIPFWAEFADALSDLGAARGECALYILESRHTDDPAPVSYLPENITPLQDVEDLPEPPTPLKDVIVESGDDIPYSGIWEPVKVDITNTLFGLKKKLLPPIDGLWPSDGYLNYLHANSPAPSYEKDGDDPQPVFWRLIWRDNRYEDGTIPEEESRYHFCQPAKNQAQRQREALVATGNLNNAPSSLDLLVQRSGQSAKRAGSWAVVGNAKASTYILKVGDALPNHTNQAVDWVWIG